MNRSLPVLLLVLATATALAAAQTPPPPVGGEAPPGIAPLDWGQISGLLPGFFRSLTQAGGENSGKKALKTLGSRLAMAEPDRETLSRKIDDTMHAVGRPQEFELMGARALPRGERCYGLAYLT